jgi:hypothetical protein
MKNQYLGAKKHIGYRPVITAGIHVYGTTDGSRKPGELLKTGKPAFRAPGHQLIDRKAGASGNQGITPGDHGIKQGD